MVYIIKILLIIIISIALCGFAYFSYRNNYKGEVVCACLAAVLGFCGQYIAEYALNLAATNIVLLVGIYKRENDYGLRRMK